MTDNVLMGRGGKSEDISSNSSNSHSSLENVTMNFNDIAPFQSHNEDDHDQSQSYLFKRVANDAEMRDLIADCQNILEKNKKYFPIRISQGSSGSYFIPGTLGKILGVFKPKDEEPYGQLNPKWTKWLHKTCCPCFFGRSCLMTNLGYVSEVGASIVDRFFGLDIVPHTELVEFSSSHFVYPVWTVINRWWIGKNLPFKIGSFQVFVEGFENFPKVYKEMSALIPFPSNLENALQIEFEKLVILDYIIRNTDRTLDNLLIHLSWTFENDPSNKAYRLSDLANIDIQSTKNLGSPKYKVKLAGIDNGLAFPYKHPDKCRLYPYEWIHLPEAQVPFSKETIEKYLPLLSDLKVSNDLIKRLETIFAIDINYNERHFRRQMSVLRGQIYNLKEAMENGESPFILAHRQSVVIEDGMEYKMHVNRKKIKRKDVLNSHHSHDKDDEFNDHEKLWLRRVNTRPCFTFC